MFAWRLAVEAAVCGVCVCGVDAAEIVNVTSSLLVSDGDSAVLECHVRANPLLVDDLITWSRRGYDLSRAVVEAPSVDRSRLTITAVQRRDAGAFHCNAFNGVGHASTAVAQLIVKCELSHYIVVVVVVHYGRRA